MARCGVESVRPPSPLPSCRTYLWANRGLSAHRDRDGRPLTVRAKEDDSALRHAVKLVLEIHIFCPTACSTIENPVSWTFGLIPCIARLCWSSDWHWLSCSYCKCADPRFDYGQQWPRKDTNFLVFGLPHGIKLPKCKLNCEYLVHCSGEWPRSKHAIVICNNPSNWPEQRVITDAMEN